MVPTSILYNLLFIFGFIYILFHLFKFKYIRKYPNCSIIYPHPNHRIQEIERPYPGYCFEVPKITCRILEKCTGSTNTAISLKICRNLFVIWQKSTTTDPKIFLLILALVLNLRITKVTTFYQNSLLQDHFVSILEKEIYENETDLEKIKLEYSDFDSTKLSTLCSEDCLEDLIKALEALFDKQKKKLSLRNDIPDLSFGRAMSSLKIFLVTLIGSEDDLEKFRYLAHPLLALFLLNNGGMSMNLEQPVMMVAVADINLYDILSKIDTAVIEDESGTGNLSDKDIINEDLSFSRKVLGKEKSKRKTGLY